MSALGWGAVIVGLGVLAVWELGTALLLSTALLVLVVALHSFVPHLVLWIVGGR